MQFFNILPKAERADFADPGQDVLLPYRQLAQISPIYRMGNELMINIAGRFLLETLQNRRAKMTVKTLMTIYKRDLGSFAANSPLAFLLDGISGHSFDEIRDGFAIAAIKYLANDGFIKLSDAENFQNREVLQYHATAMPEFRSGKFQL